MQTIMTIFATLSRILVIEVRNNPRGFQVAVFAIVRRLDVGTRFSIAQNAVVT